MVTGPSLVSETFIIAWKQPVTVEMPNSDILFMKDSYKAFACSGRAAFEYEGRRPFLVLCSYGN